MTTNRGLSRRDFLRWGGAGVAGATLFGVAGCGGGEEQGGGQGGGPEGLMPRGDIRIVMVTHGTAADPFWSVVKTGADQAASDMGVDVEYRAPERFNVVDIQRNMDAAIASQPSGIAMTIVDPDALAGSARQAIDQGIPVVVLNTGQPVWDDVGAITYVGQTEFDAGLEAGKRMAEEGVQNALCVNQEQGNVALEERCSGFTKGLGGNVRELAVQGADPTAAENAIKIALRNDPDLDGMLTLGPQGALPALKALQASGNSEITFATFDLGPEILNAVREGKMLFAIDQQQFLQGYLPVVFLTTHAQYGVAPVTEVATGPKFVTQQEAEDVIELTKQGVR
jgi:simple sugar transport system substrate-binding protein